MSRFWQDAASVFETATAGAEDGATNLAILVDPRNGLRILDGAGWTADSLRREFGASAAYVVTRSLAGVVVEGRNETETCTLRKSFPAGSLTNIGGTIPHHLVRPQLIASA